MSLIKKLRSKSHFFRVITDLIGVHTMDGKYRGPLEVIHARYAQKDTEENTLAVDLGSGPRPRNMFGATKLIGLDNSADAGSDILKCNLGFENLPFEPGSVDYVTAYDLLEHIPRHSTQDLTSPFIHLMNEVYRILKPGGYFASLTPIYPFVGAFQDPTHVNIMTSNTIRDYFSEHQHEIARFYGIKTNFLIKFEAIRGQKLFIVLQKPDASIDQ
jgi:SAM-dependent methyltransferase